MKRYLQSLRIILDMLYNFELFYMFSYDLPLPISTVLPTFHTLHFEKQLLSQVSSARANELVANDNDSLATTTRGKSLTIPTPCSQPSRNIVAIISAQATCCFSAKAMTKTKTSIKSIDLLSILVRYIEPSSWRMSQRRFFTTYTISHTSLNTGRDVAATSLEVFVGLSSTYSEVNQDININHYEDEYDNRVALCLKKVMMFRNLWSLICIIPPMKWGIGTTAEAKHTFKQSKTPFNMLLGTVVDWITFLFSTNTLVLAC